MNLELTTEDYLEATQNQLAELQRTQLMYVAVVAKLTKKLEKYEEKYGSFDEEEINGPS